MKNGIREHAFSETASVLALFLIFALFALFFALFGGRVYKAISSDMQANYELRASLSYVAGKLHGADAQGGCFVENIGGVDAIVLKHEYYGSEYRTYIYYFDGMLRELFVSKEIAFNPGMGLGIASLSAFSFDQTDRGITIDATCSDGQTNGRLTVAHRSVESAS
ncbi:MAG: DUF4860 domain-containing protein [Bacillota bacterium]